MDDRLLDDYLRELSWLRAASGDFARQYPQVASKLRLSEFDCPDPHVERLLEGFALQSARLHHRLDEGYGELSDALLELLAPHLMRPFPACSTACFTPDPLAGDLSAGYCLPAGTPLYALTQDGHTVWWRTALEQTLWPVVLEDVEWEEAAAAQQSSGLVEARCGLRMRLRCMAPHRFSSLKLQTLRIHLAGAPQVNAALFDLLYAHTLGPQRPRPIGLMNAERLLPVGPGEVASGQALSAWMHCPQALMYFDIPLPPGGDSDVLTFTLAFRRAPRCALSLKPGDIRLGCAPVVNLFSRTSEPLIPSPARSEQLLVADHHDSQMQIYQLRELWMSEHERAWRVPAYYAAHGHNGARWFWHARRHRHYGDRLWLTLVDSAFSPAEPAPDVSLTARLWCSNGPRAATLRAGTPLAFEFPGPVAQVQLLETPGEPSTPVRHGDSRWRLVSSLALNHLSLIEGEEAQASLQEKLALYAPAGAPAALWQQINGISRLTCQRVSVHRGREAWRGWRNGLRVSLTLETTAFTASSRLLFAGVIARFLAQNATANCFVQTVLQDEGEELPLWTENERPTLIA